MDSRNCQMDEVGGCIRAQIAELGISEATRRAGISPRRFSFYVNDQREPDFATLLAICEALGVTPNDLFGIKSRPSRSDGIGTRMGRRLQDLGLSEREAAGRAGLSERRFGFYLDGLRQPDLATLLDLCEALQTTPSDLLGHGEAPDVAGR